MTPAPVKRSWFGVMLRDSTNLPQRKITKVRGKKHGGSSNQKEVEQPNKARHGGPRDSWNTPGIEDLGNFRYSVTIGNEVKVHDSTSLSQMFPVFAAAVTKFAQELEMEPEGFIATAVHSLVWPTPKQQRHHVYTQISGQAGFVERTKYPQYLKNAMRGTWYSPEEVFSDATESDDQSTKVIELKDSDPDYDTK